MLELPDPVPLEPVPDVLLPELPLVPLPSLPLEPVPLPELPLPPVLLPLVSLPVVLLPAAAPVPAAPAPLPYEPLPIVVPVPPVVVPVPVLGVGLPGELVVLLEVEGVELPIRSLLSVFMGADCELVEVPAVPLSLLLLPVAQAPRSRPPAPTAAQSRSRFVVIRRPPSVECCPAKLRTGAREEEGVPPAARSPGVPPARPPTSRNAPRGLRDDDFRISFLTGRLASAGGRPAAHGGTRRA